MLPACRTAGEGFAIPTFEVVPSDVEGFMEELWEFQSACHDCFARSEPRAHFFDYMVGQYSRLECTSLEPMALRVGGARSVGCSGLFVMFTGMRRRCSGTIISSGLRRWATQPRAEVRCNRVCHKRDGRRRGRPAGQSSLGSGGEWPRRRLHWVCIAVWLCPGG